MALTPLEIFQQQMNPTFLDLSGDLSIAQGRRYFNTKRHNFLESFMRDMDGTTELQGIYDLAPLQGGKKFMAKSMQERNEQAQRFGIESDAYNINMLEQAKAGDTFNSRMEQANTRLGSIRSGMGGSASKASSAREYSGLAKNAMEATNRYLTELERFKAPEQQEIDFRFADPITGEKLAIDTSFEDVYSDRFDPADRAREDVLGTFESTTNRYRDELVQNMSDTYGNYDDYTVYDRYSGRDVHLGSREGKNVMADYETAGGGDPVRDAYFAQFNEFSTARQYSDQTAEAMAMAEMTGYDSTMTYGNKYGQGTDQTTDMSQSLLFFEADHNKLLEDMISNTTERLDIARLSERGDVEKEFNRRKDAAISQRSLADSQLRRNQDQAQSVAEEKQRVRQLMEQQRVEYAQTLSSFGSAPESKGDSVTFGDIRPQ